MRPVIAGWHCDASGQRFRDGNGRDAMSDNKILVLRDSRDRIIDLLGLGETYPLCDVAVTDELKVPFNANARLVVSPSQEAVGYQLRDNTGDGPSGRRDQPLERMENDVAVPVAADGDGGNIELVTPAIAEDVTFTIFAAKRHLLEDGDSLRSVILHQRVRIKVGLDISLPARITVTGDTELLDHQAGTDGDARLIHYNGVVDIAIDNAQEGVDYELVSVDSEGNETLHCATEIRGLGEGTTIIIQSTPIAGDVDLRVRATKKFTVAENRETEVVLLTAILPVRVRANTGLAATATPVVAYGAASEVRIAGTQTSATYQLFVRPIRDRDFARLGGVERFEVPVEGELAVPIARPAWARVWDTPAEMVAIGEPVVGNGGELVLALGELTHDTMVVVRVAKEHSTAGPTPAQIGSAVQLATATATLVAPDPTPAIELRVTMASGATTGYVEVLGGQPGVLYHLRQSADGDDLGPPAYVHQVDDVNAIENKGVGQLGVGVDLVVTGSREGIVSGHFGRLRPLNPIIPTPNLQSGEKLYLHAVKAQTRVHVALSETAELTAVPAIANERVGVDQNTPARIEITSSLVGDSYQLWLTDNAVGEPQVGNGDQLVLTSEPVEVDSTFVVLVSPTEDRGIPVHRAVEVSVPLRPQTSLRARIVASEIVGSGGDRATRLISYGQFIKVEIRNTQLGVDYRLVEVLEDSEESMSETSPGNDGNLILASHPLAEDTTLRVRAIRRYYGVEDELAEPRQLLATNMPVAVRANPALAVAVDPQAIVNFSVSPSLVLSGTQESVAYSVYTRAVADDERIFTGDLVTGEVLEVAVGGDMPAVRVPRPPKSELWADLAGFVRGGDPVAGTGGDLSLALGEINADTLVLVHAGKEHAAAPATAVQLADAELILVRPNPAPGLILAIAGVGVEAGASIDFRGGEVGVLYQLLDDQGETLSQPVYIHGMAADSETLGRGIGELRLEVDMALARARDERDPESAALVDPRVDGLTLAVGDTLDIQAKRALTGVESPLTGAAQIAALPEIAASNTTVAVGEGTTIVVHTSIVDQRYQLFQGGEPLSEAVVGTGEDLSFETGEIEASTTFHVEVARVAGEGIEVVQRIALAITVSPG